MARFPRRKTVGHMSVDDVWDYIEYNRRPGAPNNTHTIRSYEKLKHSIAKKGIQEPLMIDYNPVNQTALLTEGHHRLLAADELGMKKIPVTVFIVCKDIYSAGMPLQKVRGAKLRVDSYKDCVRANFPTRVSPDEVFPQ